MIRDSRGRTLAKTIVYRVVAIALLAGITFYYTGSAGETGVITVLFNVIGTVAYYGLERIWEFVPWGRGKLDQPVSQTGSEQRGPTRGGSPVATYPGLTETETETGAA